MVFAHVAIVAADDALARRAPLRETHLARVSALRERGLLVAGGPSPDVSSADLFLCTPSLEAAGRLIEEDPYFTGGVWARYAVTPFTQFLTPFRLPPLVADGSRVATIVEGRAADPDMVALALVEARGARRLAFGGLLADGAVLAVMNGADAAEAVRSLDETGFFAAGSLRGRPWLYVL